MRSLGARRLALAVLVAFSWGCAANYAYRQGRSEARKGNWDMAVAQFTKALQREPDSVQFRLSLERARTQASQIHYDLARKHLAADELDEALAELEIATNYDSGNEKAAESLRVTRDRIKKREAAQKRASEVEQNKLKAKSRTVVPMLSPRSVVPLTLKFPDASLEKVFDTLSKLSGVNVLFDESFKDKKVNVSLNDVTFEEALDQITFANRLFYKVLDQKTLLIIPDTAQKRRTYEDVLVRTFYLENADANDTLTVVKNLTGVTKASINASLGAITILGTLDELAMAERIVNANDKPRGEVVVEVEILEVNRTLMKTYGLALSAYQAQVDLSPTGNGDIVSNSSGSFTQVRAQLLSSLNLSDFIVHLPSSVIAKFVQSDSNTRILAAPRLRAAEGKKTSLVIGSQVPVPTTTFQAGGVPGQFSSPATAFQYRDVGVKLDLTPKITAAGEITLEMAVEFSLQGPVVNFAGQNQPTFLTRSVNGILRLKDGQTTLLGGLIQNAESNAVSGVAGLQNVPLLGSLLSSHDRKGDDTEVLISITPRLVSGPELSEEDFTPLYVGSKENVRVPSARPPLFGLPDDEEKNGEPGPEATGGAAAGAGAEAPGAVTPGGPRVRPSPPSAPPPAPAPPGTAPANPPPTGGTGDLKSQQDAKPKEDAKPKGDPKPKEDPSAPVGAADAKAPPSAAPARLGQGLTAMLTPVRPRMAVGEARNVDVVVTSPVKALAVEVVVVYDPKLLEATGVEAGSLLTLDGATIGAERSLEPGRVRVTFRRPTTASGSGIVASVGFKALQPGNSPVSIESMKVTTESGEETVRPVGAARITVGSAETPQEAKP